MTDSGKVGRPRIIVPVPHVILLQRCVAKNEPMVVEPLLRLVEGIGIQGDRHARPGSARQVLLMAEENCDLFGLAPGEVRENIVTRGIDVQALAAGTRLEIGSAALEVTRDCEPCAFIDSLRSGLRARIAGRRGMLARVVGSGEIRVGDGVRVPPSPGDR
jgi:MOSC domain-containing protein YiiM